MTPSSNKTPGVGGFFFLVRVSKVHVRVHTHTNTEPSRVEYELFKLQRDAEGGRSFEAHGDQGQRCRYINICMYTFRCIDVYLNVYVYMHSAAPKSPTQTDASNQMAGMWI